MSRHRCSKCKDSNFDSVLLCLTCDGNRNAKVEEVQGLARAYDEDRERPAYVHGDPMHRLLEAIKQLQ